MVIRNCRYGLSAHCWKRFMRALNSIGYNFHMCTLNFHNMFIQCVQQFYQRSMFMCIKKIHTKILKKNFPLVIYDLYIWNFIGWTHSNISFISYHFLLARANTHTKVYCTWILPMTINKQTIIRVIQRNQMCHGMYTTAFRKMMKAFATFHDLHYYLVKQKYKWENTNHQQASHIHSSTLASQTLTNTYYPYEISIQLYIQNLHRVLIGLMKANNFSNEL